ncbi:IPTL-CTERM sorting domain-containing protein [Acidovorax sp. SDU_ACID1]|uniref:IPTL-CTERM sorting domain-containing protein n=1 Tax=Acidovorax sp. SDU_ACID1 TaxID=3136632 RepID=UPI0038732E6F
MKHSILAPLLAASLALPAAALAQTCTGPNATSNYIVGEAEGRPSAMHWETGLVWSRCIEGATFDNGKCNAQYPTSNFQKIWVEWADHDTGRAGLLPAPFYNNVNWGLNVSISPNHLQGGAWRLPYATEYSALMTGCTATSPDIALNTEVLPSDSGGGIRNTFWTASPDPASTSAAWRADPGNPTGQMLSTAGTEEVRVVRGGQPFSALPAVAPATGVAGQPYVFAPITLASPAGTTAWGGVRISSGRLSVNAGPWVSEAIVKTGDSIRVRLIAPANGAAGVTLTLRSGETTGTTADGANGGQEATVMHEETASFSITATGTFTPRACRVTPTGTGDGTGWAQAASLADALADFSCSEVWLQRTNASGGPFYVPPSARGFAVERNVKLYGGFVGTEATRAERPDPVSPTQTTLDGNGHGRVLYLDGSLGTPLDDTLIDGIYLAMGLAAGPGANGGALYCNGAGAGSVCSPQLNRVHIDGSGADGHGGSLFNDASRGGTSSPVLTNVVIRNSSAGGDGGAIYNLGEGGTSSPVLRNVYFENTHALGGSGGAVYNLARGSGGVSSPVIEQASFNGNSAAEYGGAIFSGVEGGGTSRMEVRNATFSANRSASGQPGGAIAIVGVGGDASVDVAHATFVNNMSGVSSNALFTQGGDVRVVNSVLWGTPTAQRAQAITFFTGSTTITDSLIQDGCAGGNQAPMGGSATCPGVTRAADPQLGALDANGMDGYPILYGYLPGPSSQLLDAVACPVSADQRGIARPQGAGCDIGALERRGTVALAVTLSGSGTGTVAGATSACATGTCSYDYPGEGSAQTVALTASPAVGHTFTGWSGACSGTGTCTVTMNQARTVGAAFAGPATYTVGGTASGLAGAGLVLQNNGGDNLLVPGNGPFTFNTPVAQGGAYSVTVHTQPAGRTCTVTNGSGTASANVTSVQAVCAANTYAITASPAGNLSCAPASVAHGGTAHCVANPPVGQVTQGISGCNGTATGVGVNTYATGPVTSACTVTATFAPPPAHTLGGTVTGLTGGGLVLHNGGEDLPVPASGPFAFTQPVADGGSYAVTIAAQPTGQRCTVANASGSNVTANVGNVQVACAPYFEGTTVPASGLGGTGSATFTGGGPACRFDLGATGFEAAPATPLPGRTLPQGVLRVKLVGCTAAVAMEVTWPEPVAGYTKHGLAASGDTQPSYFAPAGLAISGRTVRFTLTDGQQGDDDWTPNGEIADPSGPTALAGGPGGAQPIPTLGEWGVALLSALLGLLALRRRAGRV